MASLSSSLVLMLSQMRFHSDSGIAIGPILFVIAILGILASAVASGSGLFNTSTSGEGARTMAATMMSYAQNVDYGVQRVQSKGYSEEQISFELPSGPLTKWQGGDYASYTENPNCTSDECQVYSVAGGGIIPLAMPVESFDSGVLSTPGWGCAPGTEYYESCVMAWTYEIAVKGLGAQSTSHLGLFFPALKKGVCTRINELVGIANPGGDPPVVTNGMQSWGNPFVGTYALVPLAGQSFGDNNPDFGGKKDFCYSDAAYPSFGYIYAHVVLTR